MSAPTGQASPYPAAALPTETFDQARKYMFLNGEGIEVLHQPAAHSDGDVVVFFRRSDVVVAGDILDMTRFPVIDVEKGGTIEGEIAALSKLVELAIPSVPIVSREAGTIVIPGHGHLCDQLDVVEYRDMVSIIRDRVRDLKDAGRTLDQVKAASPARGYTRRYGSDSGSWTTDHFVEAIYKSLPRGEAVRRQRRCTSRSFARCRRPASRGSRSGSRRSSSTTTNRAGIGADRSHRLLGGRRQRRLALPDGDAGQG